MPYYEADEGEFVDFATLDDWKDRDEAKDAEIARLTAAIAEAEARSAALVAGSYEAAAEVAAYEAEFVPVKPNDFRKAIRALTPADATAALARLIAEAKAEGMREAAGIADGHAAPLRGKASKCRDRGDDLGEAVFDSALSEANSIATAILTAAAKKEAGE